MDSAVNGKNRDGECTKMFYIMYCRSFIISNGSARINIAIVKEDEAIQEDRSRRGRQTNKQTQSILIDNCPGGLTRTAPF